MSIEHTRSILKVLNDALEGKTNGELKMELAKFDEIVSRGNVSYYEEGGTPDFLLCLNTKILNKTNGIMETHCISSISCTIIGQSITISSKTHPMYERKKYNLLLRSAMVLLAQRMQNTESEPITEVTSQALSSVSAYSMIKYFNAKVDGLQDYLEANEIPEITKEVIDDYLENKEDNSDEDDLDSDMDSQERDEFAASAPNFGAILILKINVNDAEIIAKARQTYDYAVAHIMPPRGGGRKHRKTRKTRKSRKTRKTRKTRKSRK